jgi:hypothetical protein
LRIEGLDGIMPMRDEQGDFFDRSLGVLSIGDSANIDRVKASRSDALTKSSSESVVVLP